MTLVVLSANRQQVVIAADRLLTGAPVHAADATKFILVVCRDGRACITYTGLASRMRFATIEWLIDRVLKQRNSAPKLDELAEDILRGANTEFPKIGMPTAIVLAGYQYERFGDRLGIKHIVRLASNLENRRLTKPEKFVSEDLLAPPNDAYVMPLGNVKGVDGERLRRLQQAVYGHEPAKSIEYRSVGMVVETAKSPLSGGTIGTTVSTLTLPIDPREPIGAGYYPYRETSEQFPLPHIVNASKGLGMRDLLAAPSGSDIYGRQNLGQVRTTFEDEALAEGTALRVLPLVGRNKPCPCGNGRRYRKCHGKKGATSGRRLLLGMSLKGEDLLRPDFHDL